jgi:hypothetical protein
MSVRRRDDRRCRRFAWTAAVCLLWAGGLHAAPLTMVGFNVESGDASDLVIGLQLKKSGGIDIWGLADVWPEGGWVEAMHEAAQAAEGFAYGVLVGETGGSDRLMLLYRSDRLEMLGHDELLAARIDAREPAPLTAHLRLADGTELLVVLMRLADSDKRRRAQTGVIADWAARQDLPVVALGTLFFGLAESEGPDPDMQQFLDASGWAWLRPADSRETSCERGGRVDDFVLVGGAAADWQGRAEVMFPQNNYCPDNGRTSSHRPVLARFSTGGGPLDTEAGMAERQALPLLPGEIQPGEEEAAESAAEIESLRRRVEELEAGRQPRAPAAPEAAPVAPGPATPAAVTSAPDVPGQVGRSPTVLQAGSAPTSAARPANTGSEAAATTSPPAAGGIDEAAVRRRLEALEAEVRELRTLLDQSSN